MTIGNPVEVVNADPLPVVIVPPPAEPVLIPSDRSQLHQESEGALKAEGDRQASTVAARHADAEGTLKAQGDRAALIVLAEEVQRKSAGQRKINAVWETTQATIAIATAVVTLIVCAFIVVSNQDVSIKAAAFLLLSNIFFLVVSTYFQRTNHTRSGGVGGNDVTGSR